MSHNAFWYPQEPPCTEQPQSHHTVQNINALKQRIASRNSPAEVQRRRRRKIAWTFDLCILLGSCKQPARPAHNQLEKVQMHIDGDSLTMCTSAVVRSLNLNVGNVSSSLGYTYDSRRQFKLCWEESFIGSQTYKTTDGQQLMCFQKPCASSLLYPQENSPNPQQYWATFHAAGINTHSLWVSQGAAVK